MCYSLEQSKQTFFVNLITCLLLYNYTVLSEYKIIALFFLFIGSLQFTDTIFWLNQDINDPRQAHINWVTTKIAMFINHLEPIILGYLIYTYKGSLGRFSKLILILYVLVISVYTYNVYDKITYTLQEEVNEPHSNDSSCVKPSLRWDWNWQKHAGIVYAIFLMSFTVLAYENFSTPLNTVFAFIILFSFFSTLFYFKGQGLGRFWCKISAWLPLLFILIHERQRIR